MPGELETVRIDRMAPEGQALGRPPGAGKVVFVPYGAPGDELEAEVVQAKQGYATARLRRVLKPGPGRVEPPCPYHFRPAGPVPWCGGCDWQQLAYAAQLAAKRELVLDCLRRIGRLPDVPVSSTLPSPEPWRYRNKVQVPFGVRNGRVVAGFYAPGSHEIVDFADCLVQPELSVRVALKVKELAAAYGWRIYDERGHRGWLRHLFVRANRAGQAQATLVTRGAELPRQADYIAAMRKAFPSLTGLFQNLQEMKTSVILGREWRKLWGSPFIEERIGSLKLRCSPGAFLQVNMGACEVLYDRAREALVHGGFRPELLADVYCGAGAIALWLARDARRVVGIEESREAVADAWSNARLNGIANVRFIAGRAETSLGRLRDELSRCAPGAAAVVLDPPRAGAAEAVLRALQAPQVRRVVYVSCNPATFARDAALLGRSGLKLISVDPIDLFPQTSHIELVGRFDR